MPRFLIEVPHDAETIACARVVQIFLNTGSHYLSHADWGCRDGVHKSWFVANVESKREAIAIVPPDLRAKATIVELDTFTREEIQTILRNHGAHA